jgi:hypothetical protein
MDIPEATPLSACNNEKAMIYSLYFKSSSIFDITQKNNFSTSVKEP